MPRDKNDSAAPPPVFYEITEGLLILRFRSSVLSLVESIEVRVIFYE